MPHDTAVETSVQVHRLPVRIHGDPRRIMMRFFWPGTDRARRIVERMSLLPAEMVRQQVSTIFRQFDTRHIDLETLLIHNAKEAAARLQIELGSDTFRQLLLGACMSMEYAMEAAALFNPSMIPALDQTGLSPGQIRFLLSMRAVGEGHLSSIVFRRGTISAEGELELTPPARLTREIQQTPNPQYRKCNLERKLRDMHKLYPGTQAVLDGLGETFSYEELLTVLAHLRTERPPAEVDAVSQLIIWMAQSNYKVEVSHDMPINELVLFPVSEAASHGMEDMRLVRFTENGDMLLCGTYTAFNGNNILPQMMLYRPGDSQVQMATLHGRFAQNKGMALFPRKVNGRYRMLGRCDGESNFLLSSDNIDFWDEGTILNGPQSLWEIVQVGNCGSPIETPRGWLVLTHGVGPLRRYCIGAMLLDIDNPARIIAHLPSPLMEPEGDESSGYVPNVVYSCGGMIHGDRLFIPYGISDAACGFAWVSLRELLDAMV